MDLADETHLEFDYMRWLRIVLRVVGARRVLHVGGGACALARALAAEDPGGRQEVCELDADVLALARAHLGLRHGPGLRVRCAEGRTHIAAQANGSWHAIVIDAFVGANLPAQLVAAECLADAARVAPLTLLNVVDNRSGREIGGVAAAMATAYPTVWTLGRRPGNTIVAGCADMRHGDLSRVAARAAADPSPASLTVAARAMRASACLSRRASAPGSGA